MVGQIDGERGHASYREGRRGQERAGNVRRQWRALPPGRADGDQELDRAHRDPRKAAGLGIGSVDLVGLADTREKAIELRKVARTGGDPDADRKAAAKAAAEAARRNIITFGKATEAVHSKLLPKWKNQKHADTWLSGLKLHAFPKLGTKPIQSITRDDILRVLEPIWTSRVETARRLRHRIHTVFQWAKDEGPFSGENPVDQIGLGLAPVNKNTAHLAAMPWRDVPAF